jgi:hypothetical protein
VSVLAVIVILYYLIREEPRETMSYRNTKLDDRFDLMCFKMQAGHESLNGKIDSVETSLSQRIDNLETSLSGKIDAVAADLAAHRRDTEAHPALYKVKEGN